LRHWFEKVARIDFLRMMGCKVIVLLIYMEVDGAAEIGGRRVVRIGKKI